MVNADHTEGRALSTSRESNWDSWLVKGGSDRVDRDGVVGVGTGGSCQSIMNA